MANQTTGSSSAAPPSQLTAQKVIEMFAELGLPVCDDGATIKNKFDAKREYYTRLLAKPLEADREKGKAGVKNGEALMNRRPEMLRVVYEHFARLADTALKGAISSGLKTLTQALADDLRRLARDDCKTDDSLADQFLRDYIKPPLEIGKEIVRADPVEYFVAASELGQISLSWSLPARNCDEIEIVREAESAQAGKKKRTVYTGTRGSFVDRDVTPGARFIYRARTVYQGVKSAEATARAVCLGEVRDAAAVWEGGKIRLSWTLPGAGASVLIFRRENRAPAIKTVLDRLEPLDGETTQVHHGPGAAWADANVAEGKTYHYRIIADFGADFGPGLFSQGAVVQATVPVPPPAPSSLSASYRPGANNDTVALEWRPVPGNLPVEYVVVRREGGAAPARPDDGAMAQRTKQTRCLDEQVAPGRRYSYTVFTRAGDLYSRAGASAPPVDILPDVVNLNALGDDRTVELRWDTPANTSRVVARRSLNRPRDHSDGALVNLTGPGHAKDEGLRNGQLYHYLVCCGYRPDGATEVFSPGARISAVPDQLPDEVRDFTAQAHEQEIICVWTPPSHGQAVVIRSLKPAEIGFGQRLTIGELTALERRISGRRLVTTESGRAIDNKPDANQPYYSSFTVAGSHVIAGGSASCVACPDVTELRAAVTRDGITLQWSWPEGCSAALVARRADAWPTGPDDPQATATSFTRSEYAATGDKFKDTFQAGSRARFHYVVYAQATGAPGVFFAPGTSAGCRQVTQWEPWMTLRYRIAPGEGKRQGREMRLSWSIEQPLENCAGFALVAGQTGVPAKPDDGIELFRWKPGEGSFAGDHEAPFSLDPIRQRRWTRCYCKLMMIDPAQDQTTLVIHPNVCLAISEAGKVETPRLSKQVKVYRGKVPREVLCPHCFHSFPVGEMLFTSNDGHVEAKPGRYNWVDHLRRRPPRPPLDEHGRLLTRKRAPCERKHDLPVNAGLQESLVIGLIGAKFSGKSHYIASLIKQVQERVCTDIDAALVPVNDQTQDRYQQEFERPLFKGHLQLPMTVGTPAPLIYDLTLDGRLWGEQRGRAITLTLYETAGESFEQEDKLQQMVKYLSVASGIIFLVDPLQAPAVRQLLPTNVPLPPEDVDAAPGNVISRVIMELEKNRVVTEATPLPTPVAVALTKCDVLREADLIKANRLWSSEARHIGFFDKEASDDMTGMMGECVQRWSPEVYNIVRQRFARHAFFGVSATGCASDMNTRRYKYISPWRVEDPLLWLLAELGVIPTR